MNWSERRERLRAIVEGGRCVFPASVYDGISARIAGELGFEAMMFAGSVGSFSVLALMVGFSWLVGTIEAIRIADAPGFALGVQWHAE